jgi:hypothetical protein
MTDDWHDPHDEFPYTGDREAAREWMELGRGYNGVSCRYAAQCLEVGDIAVVESERDDVGEVQVEVVDTDLETKILEADDGTRYRMYPDDRPRNQAPVSGHPWLRTPDGASRGEVREIAVVYFSDGG